MSDKKDKTRTGVMLVNLGSPQSPKPSAVRRFLRDFLSDPRVVEVPRIAWFFILNCVVLLVRPRKSAAAYRKIWSDEFGSPLIHHTLQQVEALKIQLNQHFASDIMVEAAMRYGQPSIAAAMERLCKAGVENVLLVPMYPQYSATTTASIVDELGRLLKQERNQPGLRIIKDYHDYEPYIEAMAQHIRRYWQEHGQGDKLVLSFHGLPRRCVEKGDPYARQCEKTARLLADQLLLSDEQWGLCYQSRFGAGEWLKPYTFDTLEDLAEEGVERVDVFCPGFAADCLETLEEIAMGGRDEFLDEGGKAFHYIPALNAEPAHINALMQLLEDNLQGWEQMIEEDSRNPIRKIISRVAKR